MQVKGKRIIWWEIYGPLFSLFSSHLSLNHSFLSHFPLPISLLFLRLLNFLLLLHFHFLHLELQGWILKFGRQVLLGFSPSKERQVFLASLLIMQVLFFFFICASSIISFLLMQVLKPPSYSGNFLIPFTILEALIFGFQNVIHRTLIFGRFAHVVHFGV